MYNIKIENKIPIKICTPTYVTVQGVRKKIYDDGFLVFGSFKTYGGTERNVNDVYVVEDTAIITTYYRPDIKSECRIKLENGAEYEIINEPENIEMRNQYLQFKVRRINGKA